LTGSITGKIHDPTVDAIVNKMTMISPADRYANMDEVMMAIASLNEISIGDPMTEFWEGGNENSRYCMICHYTFINPWRWLNNTTLSLYNIHNS
jgi:hypothetical protein